MKKEMVSKKTRDAVREFMVTHYVLRTIDDEFAAVNIPLDEGHQPAVPGQRRALVEQYYHSLNFTELADVRKFLQLCENILGDVDEQSRVEILRWLRRDGIEYSEGRIVWPPKGVHLSPLRSTAARIGAEHLQRLIERMDAALIDEDVDLAIGTAKELVESCCKTILAEREVPMPGNADINDLIKKVRAELKLVPDGVSEAAKGAETIKRVLSNLGTIAQGLAELRGLYGTGHGRHGKSKGLTVRHARLAVGAATTLATFLFDTHQDRGSSPTSSNATPPTTTT